MQTLHITKRSEPVLQWSNSIFFKFFYNSSFSAFFFIVFNALIKELTERQKMVLNLVYFEEMRQQDIADYLGIKQQSVNDLLNRALKTLRACFTVV